MKPELPLAPLAALLLWSVPAWSGPNVALPETPDIGQLPLNTRNIQDLMVLTPNVPGAPNFEDVVANVGPQEAGQVQTAPSQEQSRDVTVSPAFGLSTVRPSIGSLGGDANPSPTQTGLGRNDVDALAATVDETGLLPHGASRGGGAGSTVIQVSQNGTAKVAVKPFTGACGPGTLRGLCAGQERMTKVVTKETSGLFDAKASNGQDLKSVGEVVAPNR